MTRAITCHAFALRLLAAACLVLCIAGPQAHERAYADDPASGTTPLLLIVVGFSGDESHPATPYDANYDWNAAIFGADKSLASYYLDMSEGAFTFAPAQESCAFDGNEVVNAADRANDGIVHITLDMPHGSWGLVNEDSELARKFGDIVLRAFHEAAQYVDYESYDRNGNRSISTDELAVGVCIAGYDASPFDDPGRSDIPLFWPHSGVLTLSDEPSLDEMHLESYIAIAEYLWYETEPQESKRQEPIGILYHELGHHLGLPDLYPTNGDGSGEAWSEYRVGRLSLMDSGGWAETSDGSPLQSAPTALDAWSRYALRWEHPEIITESGSYTVSSQQSEAGYRTLLVPTSNPDQYFLVENRQVEGHDAALSDVGSASSPNGGIVIWQVNKETFRNFARDNELNSTDHVPGVMQLFFERDGIPDVKEPFFSARSCRANGDGESIAVELSLYGGDLVSGTPSERVPSGITMEFPDDPGRDMTVRIELSSTVAGTSKNDYPLVDDDPARRHMGGSALGRIACSAIFDETGAEMAIVNEGAVLAGLPRGDVSFEQAEKVLDADSSIVCYNLTGAQIVELIEASYAKAVACDEAEARGNDSSQLRSGVLNFAGLTYTIGGDADNAHVTSASIGGEALDANREYFVATVLSDSSPYPQITGKSPDTLVLWGCPADALRSFVQGGKWESRAAALTNKQTADVQARTAAAESADAGEARPNAVAAVGELPFMPIVIVALAALALLVGVLFAVIRAR